MADKKVIELGQRLYRLMENEDFAPFLAELDGRIDGYKAQQVACVSSIGSLPHIVDRLVQRVGELEDLRQWIDDAIERGGDEKFKQEVTEAKEVAA